MRLTILILSFFFGLSSIFLQAATSIRSGDQPEVIIPEYFENRVKAILFSENEKLPYFDISLLKDNEELLAILKQEICTKFTVTTLDGAAIPCIHFIRPNSRKLVIIGPGFPTPKEKMAPYLHIFPDCDLLFFDYRGQGLYHKPKWGFKSLDALGYKVFGVDMSVTGLGTREVEDLRVVVAEMKLKKPYQSVHGLGLCYSSFIFAQAQALYSDLFTSLICASISSTRSFFMAW